MTNQHVAQTTPLKTLAQSRKAHYTGDPDPRGEVPEWSNGAVSKTVEPSRVPRVRIPVSPP